MKPQLGACLSLCIVKIKLHCGKPKLQNNIRYYSHDTSSWLQDLCSWCSSECQILLHYYLVNMIGWLCLQCFISRSITSHIHVLWKETTKNRLEVKLGFKSEFQFKAFLIYTYNVLVYHYLKMCTSKPNAFAFGKHSPTTN